MHVCETFAKYGVTLTDRKLDENVQHHARRAVVDWYAALVPGAVMSVSKALEDTLAEDMDRGEARLALGRKTTARTAALINGTASHAAEVDDIFKYAIYHPGAPTISAALALAQHLDSDCDEFLRAVIAGYEISTRIGRTLGRAHYQYWHNTGTVGTFGAAAAAAVLLRLTPKQFAHALATSATFAAGLQQAFKMDSMSKPLHAGRAAEAGLLAAMSAAHGVTGSLNVLEGQSGMGKAMSDGPDWQSSLDDLDTVYNITRMTFKNHACCGHTFAPIDGALALQVQYQLDVENIAAIYIGTYGPALNVAGNLNPRTAAEARFSIPFTVSTALMYGSVRLSAFTEQRLDDARLRQLMARVELDVVPELDRQFPAQRSALVRIVMRDGQQHELFQPTRKGDPDMPLSDTELRDKFDELVIPVVGVDQAAKTTHILWNMDEGTRARDLIPFLIG